MNIKKATLRHGRSEFARNLRLLGVEANATDRAVRGASGQAKKDGIYCASLRGYSTYVRDQVEAVDDGWRSISRRLTKEGHYDLAGEVQRFLGRRPPVRTEGESATPT